MINKNNAVKFKPKDESAQLQAANYYNGSQRNEPGAVLVNPTPLGCSVVKPQASTELKLTGVEKYAIADSVDQLYLTLQDYTNSTPNGDPVKSQMSAALAMKKSTVLNTLGCVFVQIAVDQPYSPVTKTSGTAIAGYESYGSLSDDYVLSLASSDIRKSNVLAKAIASEVKAMKETAIAASDSHSPFYSLTISELYDRTISMLDALNISSVILGQMKDLFALQDEMVANHKGLYELLSAVYGDQRAVLVDKMTQLEAILRGKLIRKDIYTELHDIARINLAPMPVTLRSKKLILPVLNVSASTPTLPNDAICASIEAGLTANLAGTNNVPSADGNFFKHSATNRRFPLSASTGLCAQLTLILDNAIANAGSANVSLMQSALSRFSSYDAIGSIDAIDTTVCRMRMINQLMRVSTIAKFYGGSAFPQDGSVPTRTGQMLADSGDDLTDMYQQAAKLLKAQADAGLGYSPTFYYDDAKMGTVAAASVADYIPSMRNNAFGIVANTSLIPHGYVINETERFGDTNTYGIRRKANVLKPKGELNALGNSIKRLESIADYAIPALASSLGVVASARYLSGVPTIGAAVLPSRLFVLEIPSGLYCDKTTATSAAHTLTTIKGRGVAHYAVATHIRRYLFDDGIILVNSNTKGEYDRVCITCAYTADINLTTGTIEANLATLALMEFIIALNTAMGIPEPRSSVMGFANLTWPITGASVTWNATIQKLLYQSNLMGALGVTESNFLRDTLSSTDYHIDIPSFIRNNIAPLSNKYEIGNAD